MKVADTTISFGSHITQIAWVVPDIKAAEKFFKDVMGIPRFDKLENFSTRDFDPTYYGKPGETVSHVCMTWAGGSFIELIQPISGQSIFQDFLDKNPAGGIQHIAYSIPVADLDKVIADMNDKGYPVVSSFDTPIAKIVFFDTTPLLGVMTEIMGITEEGVTAVEKMKGVL
jgi:methylmalonyl-CoA/ethylmalonyl-CoA epimerase